MPLRRICCTVVVLSCIAACRTVPNFTDSFRVTDYTLTFDDKLSIEIAAPVIVLGRVEWANLVGNPMRSIGDSRVIVQLTTIRLAVELFLKGGGSEKVIDFYYYTFSKLNNK